MVAATTFPGLSVHVEVDGQPLHEYEDPHESHDGNSARLVRYIEAKAGKAFSIVITAARHAAQLKSNDVQASVYVDGHWVQTPIIQSATAYQQGSTRKILGFDVQTNGSWSAQTFLFSPLELETSRTLSKSATKKPCELGQIRIKFEAGHAGDVCEASKSHVPTAINRKVHEKELKGQAVSFSTKTGRSLPVIEPRWLAFKPSTSQPVEVVIFRYRSLADLKSEMILPRSPSPIPLEDRPEDELTVEELRELVRRQRAAQVVAKREVKRERVVDSGHNSDDGEIEAVERAPKRPRVIEQIDLTSDL